MKFDLKKVKRKEKSKRFSFKAQTNESLMNSNSKRHSFLPQTNLSTATWNIMKNSLNKRARQKGAKVNAKYVDIIAKVNVERKIQVLGMKFICLINFYSF